VPLAPEMAALLWIQRDCVFSHASAAAMWGLASRSELVHVTVLRRDMRRQEAVRVHRVPRLDPRDACLRDGLPVTTPARTLIDLAALASTATLERALAEARVGRLADDRALQAAIARASGRPGTAALKRLLASEASAAPTRSDAERRFGALIARAHLPRPVANVKLNGYEVDFLWPASKLVVEVDGHRFHSHRAAFERDRMRDQVLVASGHRVIRVTWRQLSDEPLALAARMAQALAL
jgi:very-short-patch-repair endonuclease